MAGMRDKAPPGLQTGATFECRTTPEREERANTDGESRRRVAAGSYPPAAPTDPDVPHSSIRLLGLWTRYATVHTVNYAPLGKGKGFAQPAELNRPGNPGG